MCNAPEIHVELDPKDTGDRTLFLVRIGRNPFPYQVKLCEDGRLVYTGSSPDQPFEVSAQIHHLVTAKHNNPNA